MVDKEHEIPILPQSERQARPLTQLQPEIQREAWQEVVEEHGEEITAAKVSEVVENVSNWTHFGVKTGDASMSTIVGGGKVVTNLSNGNHGSQSEQQSSILPTSERQARPLTQLQPNVAT